MNTKSILLGLMVSLFSLNSALACNWYRTGRDGEFLECRSSYKNFMLIDGARVDKIVEMAKFYAMGELQKMSNESWAIRQAITVDEGEELLKNVGEAKIVIDEINNQLRKRAALNEDLYWDDVKDLVPTAFVFGLTITINQKLPLEKLFAKLPALQPGGSVFVGAIVLPQMINYKIDSKGQEIPLTVAEKLTWDTRTVIIPSADARLGTNGQFKQRGPQVTMGMVFGENIYSTHQLLGSGLSVSAPTQLAASMPSIPLLGPVSKAILGAAALAKVDTVKIGVTRGMQSAEGETDQNAIKTYSENVWLWLRWDNGSKVNSADAQLSLPDLAKDLAQGKARASAFWVIAPWSDGESKSVYNGIDGTGGDIFGDVLKQVLGQYLSPEDMDSIAEESDLTEEQKEALTESLVKRGIIEEESAVTEEAPAEAPKAE